LIFISNLIIILLFIIFSLSYHFLNWNCFLISNLWFYFISLRQIRFLFFSNLQFFFLSCLFFLNFFSSLSLIILVGLEFYIVVFLDLFFMLWSNLMICVISSESWTGLTSSLFNFFYFIYHYWVHWKLILFIYILFFSVIISISCLRSWI